MFTYMLRDDGVNADGDEQQASHREEHDQRRRESRPSQWAGEVVIQ
jgi:hypothetical protein